MSNLDKKIAIVSGGTSGIGLAIANRLSQDGVIVVIAARDSDKGNSVLTQISNSEFIQTDVTQEDSIKNLIEMVIQKHGKIDMVINNAGMDFSHPDITQLTEEQYYQLMDADFKSVVLMTKHAIPHLVTSKGSMVNIASQLAFSVDTEVPLYCAAKVAVVMWTKSMAKIYGKDGVRINASVPVL